MTTILLVEDDLALAMHWRQALEAEDFRVIHEPSVEGAIDVLEGTSVDVVITDIVLETKDDQLRDSGGFAVISYIALNLDPQPKIIATSGEASNSNFVDRNFKKMDSMRALRKPVSGERLVAMVCELLNDTEQPRRKVALDDERIRQLIYSDEAMLELLAVWDWKVGTDEATYAPGFRKLLGFEGNDVQGFPDTLEAFAGRIHSDDQESIWAEVNKSLQDQTPFVHDFRLKRKDGSYIWVRSQATASFDDRGNALRMVGATHDITEEQALKQEARRTNERFNWAMTNANIGVWEWIPETDVVNFDAVCKTQLGYSPDEPWQIFSDETGLLHEDDFAAAGGLRQSLSENPSETCETLFRLRTATGDYRWIRSIGRGVVDDRGQCVRIVGVHIDVHDLQVAKQNAEESEARFRALANSASPLAWTTELDSTCSWLNKRWLEYSGTTLESQLGYGWLETVHEDDRERAQASYTAAFEKQEAFVLDYRLRRHDGVFRWFTVNATPRFDEAGEFCGYVGMSFDSHDTRLARESLEASEKQLVQTNQNLEAANAELEQFAYVASHDLRTPIRGISHIVSFIRDDEGDNLSASSQQYLDKLDGRVRRMEALLDDMLAYSRVGKQAEREETVDLTELVAETVDLLSLPTTFQVSVAGELPTLKTLKSPLQQVLLNLIGNAQKYHDREHGRVELTAAEEGRFVRFAVSDDGPGIEEQYHEKIFKMFQRLHSRDEVEGTGLGLALVRKLVRQLGGNIWVESKLGEGATFHFTWPKVLDEK